ncbi:hypothetical protein HLB23_01275 [Nocardia uniformis]|uniref:Uncharacterized protein n=1 Tax=Nocardia uniformis TaxID=53432 RepID=A0A849BR23_9NOCA|nr:hypothetical protein [Nocardia uniformis]NNH68524.1 hypothetical protein [Nocardia uniformis]
MSAGSIAFGDRLLVAQVAELKLTTYGRQPSISMPGGGSLTAALKALRACTHRDRHCGMS